MTPPGEGAVDLPTVSLNDTATTLISTPSLLPAFDATPQDTMQPSHIMDESDNPQTALHTPGVTISPNSINIPVFQAPPPSKEVSEKQMTSLKRIDQSDSEKEEGSSVDDMDMSLITPEDSELDRSLNATSILTLMVEAQLQQRLFKTQFAKVPPPKKSLFRYPLIVDLS